MTEAQYAKISSDMRRDKYIIQSENACQQQAAQAVPTNAICDAPEGFVREEHSPSPFFTPVS